MKVKRMWLKNYRGLEEFEIGFDKRMTVIIGANGCGKSSVVAGIRLLLWSYVRAFGKEVRGGKTPTIPKDDIYFNGNAMQYPCAVEGEMWFEDGMFADEWEEDTEEDCEAQEEEFWTRDLNMNVIGCRVSEEHKRVKWDGRWVTESHAYSKALDALSESMDRALGNQPVTTDLPVIACYGTNRLWKKNIGYRPASQELIRAAGYNGAVNLSTNFLGFEKFIAHGFSYIEAGLFDRKSLGSLWLGVTKAVRLVTGWDIILPTNGSPDLVYRQADKAGLKFSQLGDGVRCMIGLVGDLACRCALLNPHHGKNAPEKTAGVVLIDEIDLHLHPSWQQTIVAQLQQAFPEIQFIITTHSPQVLSTLRRENIRVLNMGEDGKVFVRKPAMQFYGEPSGDVLQGVMLVDPQPPIPEKSKLQRLTALVDQGLYDGAESIELMLELENVFGNKHPQLQRLRRSILRQRAFSV